MLDGYMRWYTDDTVLLTQPEPFLAEHGLRAIEVPAFIHRERKYPTSAIGGYVNYLIVDELLLLPVFDVPGNRDEEVIRLLNLCSRTLRWHLL